MRNPERGRSLAIVLCAAALLLPSAGARAGFVTVCTEADLDALIAAGGGPHQVDFLTGCATPFAGITSTKTIAVPLILESTTPGEQVILRTASGAPDFRMLHVPTGSSLELTDFVVVGGTSAGDGGLILNEGTLSLRGTMLLDGNTAGRGGAVANLGTATLEETLVLRSGATGGGGALYSAGSLTLIDSDIWGNSASSRGGGILSTDGGSLVLSGTTVRGNEVLADDLGVADGGGLFADGAMDVERSTISGNTAARDGGGIFLQNATANVHSTTVADNTAVGAGSAFGGSGALSATQSLVDGDCTFVATSAGYNVESPGSTCGFGAGTDRSGVTPAALALAPLGNNSGPNATHALRPGSVAIDAIPAASCLPTDQRGAPRPDAAAGLHCDVGAYEWTRATIGSVQALVRSGDPDPRGGRTIESFREVVTTNGQVAFMATDSGGDLGLYLHDGTTLHYVAGPDTPVPGGVGSFDFEGAPPALEFRRWALRASAGTIVLWYSGDRTCADVSCPFTTARGYYVASPSQPLQRCAGVGDMLPGGLGTISTSSFDPVFAPGPDGVTFAAEGLQVCGAAGITTLVPAVDPQPNGEAIHRSFLGPISRDEGSVLWGGSRALMPAGGAAPVTEIDAGLYDYDAALDESLLLLDFESGLIRTGATVVHRFHGVTFLGNAVLSSSLDGIWNDASGTFQQSHASPFLRFNVMDFSRGVAFGGSIGSWRLPGPCAPIGATLSGIFEPVFYYGDLVEPGKTTTCLRVGQDFVDATQLAFVADFDDATSAIYATTVPEPEALLAQIATIATLLTLARRRRAPEAGLADEGLASGAGPGAERPS